MVVRADEVADALSVACDELGYDHCACVTGRKYADRYESIYHLRRYNDPTDKLSVVVPVLANALAGGLAAGVYRTGEWHEREARDFGTTLGSLGIIMVEVDR